MFENIKELEIKLRRLDIPGDEPPRIGGEKKLKIIKWGLAYMFEVIREVFVWK